MNRNRVLSAAICIATCTLAGGLPRADAADAALSAQATSTFALGEQDSAKVVEITNVIFATTGSYVPGRPQDERLILRTTTRSREVIDEKGIEATVTVEAWPLGADLTAKPLYRVSVGGVRATAEDNALLVINRGTEDVNWWSIYALGTGAPLFDTFVPLLHFSITNETQTLRYAGFDVPPDDTPDPRLRKPEVVGVLSYASPERVIRRLLVTCSDLSRAAVLRSYWDTTREFGFVSGATATYGAPIALLLSWRQTDSMAIPRFLVSFPIAGDDIDLAEVKTSDCISVAPWSP